MQQGNNYFWCCRSMYLLFLCNILFLCERDQDLLIMDPYHQLNKKGQDKAIELIELLTKIPEYKKSPKELEDSIPFLASYDWSDTPESSKTNSTNANTVQKKSQNDTDDIDNNENQ